MACAEGIAEEPAIATATFLMNAAGGARAFLREPAIATATFLIMACAVARASGGACIATATSLTSVACGWRRHC